MVPLPLQTISKKRVYLNNIIFGRYLDASFQVDSKDFNFAFSFFSPPAYKPTVFFKIKLSDHILWLSLDALPPLSYFSKKFEGIDLTTLPPEIQSIILESSFDKILNNIEDELGIVLSIEEYTFTTPDNLSQDQLPFVVDVNGFAKRIHGCIYVTEPALEFLAAILESIPPVRRNNFSSIDIPLHAIIAEEVLSYNQFKNLKLRDIIILNDQSFINNGSCKVIIADYLIYSGILKNKTLTLDALMEKRPEKDPNEDEMDFEIEDLHDSDENEDEDEYEDNHEEESHTEHEEDADLEEETSSSPLPRDLEDVQINLSFEVGQKRIPLKDLQALKSGYTFELENSADRPVNIRANGRIIGTGELLKIGDRVGIRVTSFSKK